MEVISTHINADFDALASMVTVVKLYRALGGDWQIEAAPTPPPACRQAAQVTALSTP